MLEPRQFWILTAIGALALVLAAANMVLFETNTALKAEATSRAQYIQQSVALENLYQQIVQELAQRAVRTRDEQVRDLLATAGFSVSFDAPAGRPEAGNRER